VQSKSTAGDALKRAEQVDGGMVARLFHAFLYGLDTPGEEANLLHELLYRDRGDIVLQSAYAGFGTLDKRRGPLPCDVGYAGNACSAGSGQLSGCRIASQELQDPFADTVSAEPYQVRMSPIQQAMQLIAGLGFLLLQEAEIRPLPAHGVERVILVVEHIFRVAYHVLCDIVGADLVCHGTFHSGIKVLANRLWVNTSGFDRKTGSRQLAGSQPVVLEPAGTLKANTYLRARVVTQQSTQEAEKFAVP
jgi:hypothetical protein